MIKLDIKLLKKAFWNYRKDDKSLMSKLVANIKKNGQIENLIVRELAKGKYEIVNGNHRFDALNELNIKKAWCYNLGKISLPVAKRVAIETNETRFDTDMDKLDDLMRGLGKSFNVDDLKLTMSFDDLIIPDIDSVKEEHNKLEQKEITICPKCQHKWIKKSIDKEFKKEYRQWANMKQRCLNPDNPDYKHYGKRGIKICNRWNEFSNFIKDMGRCPKGLSLERIKNNKGYSLKNCKWETKENQNKNRRKFKKKN